MPHLEKKDSSHSSSKKDSENSGQENCSSEGSPLDCSNKNELKELQSGKVLLEQTTNSNSNKAFSQGLKSQLSFKRRPAVEDLSFESLGVEGQGRKRLHYEHKKPKKKIVEKNVERHDLAITNQIKDDNQAPESLDLKKDDSILEEKRVGQKVSETNKHLGPISTAFQQQNITSYICDGQESRKLPPVSPLSSVPQNKESYEHILSSKNQRILEEHGEGCFDENVKKYVEEHVQYDDPDPTVYQNNESQGHLPRDLQQNEPIVEESQVGQKVEKAIQQQGFDASSQQQSLIPDISDRQSSLESAPLSNPNKIHQNEEIYDSDEILQQQSSMGNEKQRQQRKSTSSKIVRQLSVSQSHKYLTAEEYKIFTEGFQCDENFFSNFFRRVGPPLFQLIKQKQKPTLAVDLLSEYGLKQASDLNRKTFVSMMADKRLEKFWLSLIEEKNIMDKLFKKKQRSNIQKKYSKLEFIFQRVFQTKRLESLFEYKDELILAAKSLKAMRDNGQLPMQEKVHSIHQKFWNQLSEDEKSLAMKAYERKKFDVRSFIYAFRKIIINIVREKIKESSDLMRTQIMILEEKKRKITPSDCQFLFINWQFCKIWPKIFQQDLINQRYLKSSDSNSLRVKEYSTMTVLFQKLYLQGKFTNIYQNKELFLELAEKIVDGKKKSEHFQKKPQDFWKTFDSGKLEAERKVKFQKKNKKQSKLQNQGQLQFKRLFRAERKLLIEKLMKEEPDSNYDKRFKSQSFANHLNKVYQSAFYKLFLQKMSKEEIQNDQELNMIFLQRQRLTQKGYYRILTHSEMSTELRKAFKENKLSQHIRAENEELKQNIRIYYEFQNIFSAVFDSLVKKK